METRIRELNEQIMALTNQIQTQFPDVYRNLNEMPITIPNVVEPEIKVKQLEDYVQSLTKLISTHSGSSSVK